MFKTWLIWLVSWSNIGPQSRRKFYRDYSATCIKTKTIQFSKNNLTPTTSKLLYLIAHDINFSIPSLNFYSFIWSSKHKERLNSRTHLSYWRNRFSIGRNLEQIVFDLGPEDLWPRWRGKAFLVLQKLAKYIEKSNNFFVKILEQFYRPLAFITLLE